MIHRLLAGTMVLTLGACVAVMAPQVLTAQVSTRLVPIQRFGWEDPAGPDGSATPAQRRLDGGMLSKVVDLAEGADGSLYVLDRGGFKVVAFDAKGNVKRVIGHGEGERPGEWVAPTSLTLSDAGELFVLDQKQSRVTVFDTTGKLSRTFPIASTYGYQIRARGTRLYISQFIFKADAPIVLVYDFKGTLVERLFPPSAEDVSFGRTGNTYRMATMRDGRIAVAHPNPGTWAYLDDARRPLGLELVEKNVVRQPAPDRGWMASTALRGFGEWHDGRALILYDRVKPEAMNTPERPRWNIFLGFVGSAGGVADVIDVGEVGRNLLVSRDGRSFYLTVAEPSYQVVRFRLAAP
jgi:hypothetical protein